VWDDARSRLGAMIYGTHERAYQPAAAATMVGPAISSRSAALPGRRATTRSGLPRSDHATSRTARTARCAGLPARTHREIRRREPPVDRLTDRRLQARPEEPPEGTERVVQVGERASDQPEEPGNPTDHDEAIPRAASLEQRPREVGRGLLPEASDPIDRPPLGPATGSPSSIHPYSVSGRSGAIARSASSSGRAATSSSERRKDAISRHTLVSLRSSNAILAIASYFPVRK